MLNELIMLIIAHYYSFFSRVQESVPHNSGSFRALCLGISLIGVLPSKFEELIVIESRYCSRVRASR